MNSKDDENRVVLCMFAIKDKNSESFINFRNAINSKMMIRQIQMELAEAKNSVIVRYPQDFALYYIGNIDTKTAKIVPSKIEMVSEMIEILNEEVRI